MKRFGGWLLRVLKAIDSGINQYPACPTCGIPFAYYGDDRNFYCDNRMCSMRMRPVSPAVVEGHLPAGEL